MNINRQIEIDWMLENYRTSKHYKDHVAAYEDDKIKRKAILDELREREPEWNTGSIQRRRKDKQRIINEILGRDDE